MAPPRPRRSMGPLIAIIAVVVIIVVGVLGYAVGGYVYSQGRLNSASKAYNAVVDHENSYTDTITSLSGKMTNVDVNATTAQLQQNKTLVTQFTTSSQHAAGQIDGDEASLAKADTDLRANSWLTAISKSEIDKADTRIGHVRKALADAKQITADYVQLGTFYQSFYDLLLDFDAISNAATAQDVNAIAAAVAKVKTDATKAISQDKAPGLPPEMDGFLQVVQTTANDFTTLLAAAAAHDQAGADAATAKVDADASKLDTFDFGKMGDAIAAFYKPMIDDYNSEVDKANNT
jgi:hypothetical protein